MIRSQAMLVWYAPRTPTNKTMNHLCPNHSGVSTRWDVSTAPRAWQQYRTYG